MTQVRARLLQELEEKGAADERFAQHAARIAAQRQQELQEEVEIREEELSAKKRRISR